MNVRGRRRGPRTWLAIQARTYASTSGDLRTLAHVRASNSRSVTLSTMGDRRIAASNAYKRAPVLIMLSSLARAYSMGEPLNNAVGLEGFLTPRLFSRRTGAGVRAGTAVRVRRADGGEMANLRQRSGNVRIREELPTPARPSHKPLPAERCAVRHDQKIVMSSCRRSAAMPEGRGRCRPTSSGTSSGGAQRNQTTHAPTLPR